jgi:type IV secretory pathway VirB4 component
VLFRSRSSIDFSSVVNDGKILLVDLCKGRIGDTNMAFLAMVLIALIQRAAFARTSSDDKSQLRDFHLYIDEFQNVATDSFVTILSEARKYRLCATLTNQYLHQIPKEIADAVIGNVGTTIAFRSGAVDADLLIEQFGTSVEREDFVNLPNFHAYVRTLVHGQAIAPFSIRTVPHEATPSSDTAEAIQARRSSYGMAVGDVDALVARRWESQVAE